MKARPSQTYPPGLYVVATPIGNLKDITLRALEMLEQADLIVCEDTRVTGKLLAHYGIKKPVLSYNDHNAPERRPKILAALEKEKRVALVSDAGTPLVSDPGYKLVREVLEKNIHVTPLPGASSVLAGLVLSGLPSDQFFFAGFPPTKPEACKRYFEALVSVPATLIFFESARRLPATLSLLEKIFGSREAAVAREITKLYEETRRGTLDRLSAQYAKEGVPKGEVVIIVAPPDKATVSSFEIEARLRQLLASHSVKEASVIAAVETARPRKEMYALALKLTAEMRNEKG